MGINRKPTTTGDGRTEDETLATEKKDYNDLTEPEVIVWRDTLFKSIDLREKEQAKIKKDTGGEEAHQERLKNDPEYKKKWDNHETRIKKEEKAYDAAQEWLKGRE